MLPSTIKTSIVTTCLLLGAVGVYGGSLYLLSIKEASVQSLIQEKVITEKREHEASALTALLENTVREREQLRAFVVTEQGVITFLEEIEEIGRERGVETVITVSTQPLEGSSVFEHLALSVQFQGSYVSVRAFLSALETLPFQITLQSVNLDRVGGEGETLSQWRGTSTFRVTKEKDI